VPRKIVSRATLFTRAIGYKFASAGIDCFISYITSWPEKGFHPVKIGIWEKHLPSKGIATRLNSRILVSSFLSFVGMIESAIINVIRDSKNA